MDHNLNTGHSRLYIQIGDGVNHIDQAASKFDGFGRRQFSAGAKGIDVASNGGDWSDGAELIKEIEVAYISGMKDVIGTGNRR